MIDLSHLSETEFEEFCFDLLNLYKFTNLRWRKGTMLPTSPSDRGRDIECEFIRQDFDDSTDRELWFIECKHYTKGVPPDKIVGALSWAYNLRPHTLLIITSGFLSNAALDFVREWKENNKPAFRIKYRDNKEIEKLTSAHKDLLRKYKIHKDKGFFDNLHPLHANYLMFSFANTLDHFAKSIELLGAKMALEVYDILCANLNIVDYEPEEIEDPSIFFVNKAYDAVGYVEQSFLIRSLTLDTLDFLYNKAYLEGGKKNRRRENLNKLKSRVERKYGPVIGQELERLRNVFAASEWVASFVDPSPLIPWLDSAFGQEQPDYVSLYEKFCVVVVGNLLREQIST